MKNRTKFPLTLLAVLILSLSVIIFYRYHILGKVVVPFDSKDQYYPFAVFVSHSFKVGDFPLWNPFIFSGTPSYADPLYMTFYPGYLLALLPAQLSQQFYDIITIIHVLFGGISLYLLLREYKINFLSSIIAATVFMLGGPFAARLQHVAQIYTTSLMPIAILLIHRGIKSTKWKWFGGASLVLGFLLMIGYQLTILFLLLSITYFLVEVFLWNSYDSKQKIRLLIFFCITLIGAVGLAAIQILPSLEFASLSNRPEFSFGDAIKSSMPLATILTAIFPNVYNSIKGTYWGPFDVTEGYLYFGLVSLYMVYYSVVNWKILNNIHKYFMLVTLTSLLFALGKHTPVYSVFYYLIPPLRLFKRASESLLIFHFCVSVIIGFGIDYWFGRRESTKQNTKVLIWFLIIFMGVGLFTQVLMKIEKPDLKIVDWIYIPSIISLLFFFAVSLHKKSRQYILIFLLISILGDLTITNSQKWFNSSKIIDGIAYSGNFGDCEVELKALNELPKDYRFEIINAGSKMANIAAIWRIPSSIGYSPLVVDSYDRFASPINTLINRDFSGLIDGYNSQFFDLLGVKLILSTQKLEVLDPNVDLTKFKERPSNCLRVYENNNALPLVFLVNHFIIMNGFSEDLEQIPPTIDLGDTAFLEKLPEELVNVIHNNDGVYSFGNGNINKASVIRRSNNNIFIQTISDADNILVFNDVYYPGWYVFIDGVEKNIIKTNYTFKGVFVPSGNHLIEFIFDPSIFKIGLAISVGSIFTILTITISSIKRGSKKVQ